MNNLLIASSGVRQPLSYGRWQYSSVEKIKNSNSTPMTVISTRNIVISLGEGTLVQLDEEEGSKILAMSRENGEEPEEFLTDLVKSAIESWN